MERKVNLKGERERWKERGESRSQREMERVKDGVGKRESWKDRGRQKKRERLTK